MTVVIRQADGLVSASPAEFDSEAELERVLADQVQLLQSAVDHRLAFVGRQVDLPDAGILDVLCVDENGLPVAVEVKLARNGESRRQVVAQIVDYLSALTALTVDELDARTEGALKDALRSFDPPGGDPASFERRWQACGANLRAGLARIVVALDSAPTDLERIVQFLSERSNLDIRLVTISKFVEPRVGTLYVPTVLVSNEGEPAPRPSVRPTAPADPAAFMEEWAAVCGPEAADAWAALVDAARGSKFAGLDNFRWGCPYIYVTSGSMEPVKALRLVDRKPLVRDQLHQGSVWDGNQRAQEARERFRRTLVEQVPGAKPAGAAGRVEAPVVAAAARRDAVIEALSALAQGLAGAAST